MWPGTSATARKTNIRHIAAEGGKNEDESMSGDKSESSDEYENSDTEGEEEDDQVNWDHVWPGTRERARHKTKKAGQDVLYEARGAGLDGTVKSMSKGRQEQGRGSARTKPNDTPKAEDEDPKSGNNPARPKKLGKEGITEGATNKIDARRKRPMAKNDEGLDDKVQGKGAGLDEEEQGMGAGLDGKVQARTKPSVNLKTEPKDNIHDKNVITKAKNKDGMEQAGERGWTTRCRAREQGWTRWCRARERGWTSRCRARERGWTRRSRAWERG